MRIRLIAAAAAAAGLALAVPGPAAAQPSLTDQVKSLDVAAEQGGYPGQDALNINYDRDELLARNHAAFPGCDGYFSRYDNQCYTSADEVDGDHLVAIAEAWRSGGADWSEDQWEAYDGDLSNMAVMTDDVNQHDKSDKDVTGWVPSHDTCHFVGVIVGVKAEYDLAVDRAERQALLDLAAQCDPGEKQPPQDPPSGGGEKPNPPASGGQPEDAPDPEPVEGDLPVTG